MRKFENTNDRLRVGWQDADMRAAFPDLPPAWPAVVRKIAQEGAWSTPALTADDIAGAIIEKFWLRRDYLAENPFAYKQIAEGARSDLRKETALVAAVERPAGRDAGRQVEQEMYHPRSTRTGGSVRLVDDDVREMELAGIKPRKMRVQTDRIDSAEARAMLALGVPTEGNGEPDEKVGRVLRSVWAGAWLQVPGDDREILTRRYIDGVAMPEPHLRTRLCRAVARLVREVNYNAVTFEHDGPGSRTTFDVYRQSGLDRASFADAA